MYKLRSPHTIALAGLLLLAVLGWTMPLAAQQYLGTLSGNVTDSTGAKVVGAQVTATDITTNFVTKVVTNGSGDYSIPFLTPDTYSVTIVANGFRSETRTGVTLTAGQNQDTDFALKPGTATQDVIVTADTQLLDTTSANLSTTFSTAEVTDTPNIGRNPFVLVTLAAGIYSSGSGGYFQGKASTFTNPFSGAAVQIDSNGSGGHNRLTLDGIPDDPSERLSGSSYTGFVPSPEAVQEVKVQTAVFDAQYGHGNGVVTNTVLRAGSNAYHGAVYDVFRNTYMNANTFERVPNQNCIPQPAGGCQASWTPRSSDQWQQPGAVLSGPLTIPHVYNAKDKSFFMVAYEYLQLHQTLPYQSLVPLPAMANGDFSSLCSNFVAGICAPGAGIQIYDPTSVASGTANRTPFLNNQIPTGRINAAGKSLLGYFPAPNSNFSPTVNYISSKTSVPNRYYSFATRVDHQFSEKQHLDATFFKAVLHQFEPNEGFPTPIGPTGTGYTVYRNNEGGSIEDSYAFSPTLVMNARFGVIYHPFGLVYPGANFTLSNINISGTNLPYQSFPGTSASDSYAGLAAGNTGQVSEDTLGSTSVMVAKTLQKHSLRFGFEGNLSRYNVQNPQSGVGVFNFNRQFTQQNSSGASGANCPAASCTVGGDPASGNAIASMLLGYASSGTYGNTIAYAMQQKYLAFYVQDDFRVNSKLTINAGLRWDYESPFSERFNRLNAGFCLTCATPGITGLPVSGGLTFVATAASPSRYAAPQKYNNFQPRLGVAYEITPKIVFRSGVGLIFFNTQDSPLSQGYSNSTSYVASNNSVLPTNLISSPWPTGVQLPTGNTLGLATQLGQSLTYPDPNAVQPKIWQWSTSLQFQLPYRLVLQLAYVGQTITQLPINKNVDALPASQMGTNAAPLSAAQIATLSANVTNPLAGQLPGSSMNAATVPQYWLKAPYPQFTGVTDNYQPYGSQGYNALQVTVNKQLSNHFVAQANFTYSRIMDELAFLNPQASAPFRYQDNQPNVYGNIWGTYYLPTLQGKPAWEQLPLGGWKLQGVMRFADGTLINNPGSTGGNADNPGTSSLGTTYGQLRNPKTATRSYTRFFNTCWENSAGVLQFTTVSGSGAITPGCDSTNNNLPAFQANPSFTLNSIGPYMNLRELVHPLADISLFKTFKIHEALTFEIRGEFFNVFNTPNFGGPGTGPGTSSWGFVTQTQANDPRLTQLTGRINF